jgi:Domain of unknown function (DUF4286)
MPDWLLVASCEVDPEVEEDWNRWYDEVHVPEMVDCPGWVSAERYVTEDESGKRRYVSIYEVEGPQALQSEEFEARRGWREYAPHVTHTTRLYRRVSSHSKS